MSARRRHAPEAPKTRPSGRTPGASPETSRAENKLSTTSVSDALRQEAEREWAAADQAAGKRKRRGEAKARRNVKRRATAKEQTDEIAKLKDRLKRAEQQTANERRHTTDAGGR